MVLGGLHARLLLHHTFRLQSSSKGVTTVVTGVCIGSVGGHDRGGGG